MRGEESGESSSSLSSCTRCGGWGSVAVARETLSDEEVCFPSLDRFGGFSVTAEKVRGTCHAHRATHRAKICELSLSPTVCLHIF